ncbi:MAG TPA: fatty acid desaturase [Chitinophagaceae bacterium]
MLSGKQLILTTKPFAKEIHWKSWYYTFSSFFLLAVSLFGTYFAPWLWAKIGCSLFAALMLARCFMIFHDFQHHSILRKSWLANFIFTVFGMYILTPASIWKRSHDHHHNNNSKLFSASIGSFPIMTKEKFLEASDKDKKIYLAVRHPLTILFAYFTMFLYGMCLQSFLSSPRRHWDSLAVFILHIGASVFVGIYFGPMTWFLTIFLPLFIVHMLGAYLFYAQHNFPGVKFRSNIEWCYEHAALESSSYMSMNRFMQWATANIGFHHIHHINSKIPFYRLPETMAKIPELQKATVTRLTPSDIIKCLRLKLWDAGQNRMITLAEIKNVQKTP